MTMGEETASAALRTLFLRCEGAKRLVNEETIYNVFLEHTPTERKQVFIDLYRRLHGGAHSFPEAVKSDDHSDQPTEATPVVVGEKVEGKLDYMFDFDYFRFQTKEGQKYLMSVNHDTLRSTSVALFGPEGTTGENQRWKSREQVATGPRIIWTAPSTDEYYFAVQNVGAQTGSYTLVIASIDSSLADDHGDTASAATDMMIGEVTEGTIADEFDIDFFRCPVVEGRSYRFEFMSGSLTEFRFGLRLPDIRIYKGTASDYQRRQPSGFTWTARSSGKLTLSIDGAHGDTGTYSLKIAQVDNE